MRIGLRGEGGRGRGGIRALKKKTMRVLQPLYIIDH